MTTSEPPATSDSVELLASHEARVGSLLGRRALPQRRRRSVGAWCFADHMGPADVTEEHGLDIGPHPHTGLQTVTWLIDGQALHRDSLGSEQVIEAGELNVMTAGFGVAHAEEATGHYRGVLQGIQLWIAQDEERRHGAADFEHLAVLPRLDLNAAQATVFVGELHGARSPARTAEGLLGVELRARGRGTSVLALRPDFEYGVVALTGRARLNGADLAPGTLAYCPPGRDEMSLDLDDDATLILLGGTPLAEPVFMWWNFVARSRAEIDAAYDSWVADDGRFPSVSSALARIVTDPPYWRARPRADSAGHSSSSTA